MVNEKNNNLNINSQNNKNIGREDLADSFAVQQEKFNQEMDDKENIELKKSVEAANDMFGSEEDKNNEITHRITRPTVKTYRDFAVKALKDKPTSLAKMIIKEKKKEELKYERSPKNKKNILMIILSVILVILGIVAIGSIVIFGVNKSNEVSEKNKSIAPKSVIYFDYKSEVELDGMDRNDLVKLLDDIIENTNIPIGDIKIYYFVKRDKNGYKTLVRADEFFSVLDTRVSSQFIRNLEENFSTGVVSTINSTAPFMIFKISNFDTVYASLLSWENTMLLDLGDILKVNKKYYAQNFSDISIFNKDVRAVFDEEGKIVFGYSFIDLNTLVFFTEAEAFKKIVSTLGMKQEKI